MVLKHGNYLAVEKSAEKIDGAVASIMALDQAVQNGGNTESVYDKRRRFSFLVWRDLWYTV